MIEDQGIELSREGLFCHCYLEGLRGTALLAPPKRTQSDTAPSSTRFPEHQTVSYKIWYLTRTTVVNTDKIYYLQNHVHVKFDMCFVVIRKISAAPLNIWVVWGKLSRVKGEILDLIRVKQVILL